jgi:hypothetical protein
MKFTESGQPCNNWPCCDKVEVAIVAVAMVAVAMVAVATWAQKILEKIFYTILQNIVFMKMMMVPSLNYLECNLIFTPLFQFYIQVSHLMYHVSHDPLLVKYLFSPSITCVPRYNSVLQLVR